MKTAVKFRSRYARYNYRGHQFENHVCEISDHAAIEAAKADPRFGEGKDFWIDTGPPAEGEGRVIDENPTTGAKTGASQDQTSAQDNGGDPDKGDANATNSAPAKPPVGATLTEYAKPEAVGYAGWYEKPKGALVGFKTLEGAFVPLESVEDVPQTEVDFVPEPATATAD